MKELVRSIFIFVLLVVIILTFQNAYATSMVTEEITGSSGDWTYTYTIHNNETLPIWTWAIWFPADLHADDIIVNFGWVDGLDVLGFFPEAFTDYWGNPVYDEDSFPLTTNLLEGPNGEPGCYIVSVNDCLSQNYAEYWDGTSWQPLLSPDTVLNNIWRGEYYGWTGSDADIQTGSAIPVGGTGEIIMHSSELMEVPKSFSFSTTDYWCSLYDPFGTSDYSDDLYYWDFEKDGATTSPVPEPSALFLLGLGIIGIIGFKKKYC